MRAIGGRGDRWFCCLVGRVSRILGLGLGVLPLYVGIILSGRFSISRISLRVAVLLKLRWKLPPKLPRRLGSFIVFCVCVDFNWQKEIREMAKCPAQHKKKLV